jgi:hypothetical protein
MYNVLKEVYDKSELKGVSNICLSIEDKIMHCFVPKCCKLNFHLKFITMKSIKLLFVCFLIPLIAYSQHPDLIVEPIEGPVPWSNLDINSDADQFQFAIVTDRTGGHRAGVFMDAINKLNLLQPEFVLSVGDFIEGYTEDLSVLNNQWDEFNDFIDQLEMPFFYVPGNHDITNKVMEDLWKEKFGRSWYHFIYKDVLFLCLNSEDQFRGAGRGSISDEQFQWLEQTLDKNKDVKWTLVFLHQPLWDQSFDTQKWPEVEKLLEDREHTVICGHRHHYVRYKRNDSKYIILATTGGGSQLRGTSMGEFDQLAWVTMTSDGPLIANLLLNGIWDEDVNTEERMDYVSRLYRSQPLQIEPLIVEDERFEEGSVTIKISNRDDKPMHVRLKEHFAWDLNGKFSKNELVIEPKGAEEVELMLEARDDLMLEDLRPFKTSIEFSSDKESVQGVFIPADLSFKPIKRQKIKKRNKKVRIDGKLKEWKALPYQFGNKNGSDLSVQYQMSYDDKYLYLAAKVLDDILINDNSSSVWQLDNLCWIVNAERMEKSIMSMGRGYYRLEFQIRNTPDSKEIASRAYHPERLPEGTKSAYRATKNGYEVECAIPISAINDKQMNEWQYIRSNVIVDDYDKTGGENDRVSAFPDWWTKESYIGSGLFFK